VKFNFYKDLSRAKWLIKKFFSLKLVKVVLVAILLILFVPLVFFFFMRPKVQHDINYGVTFSKKYATELGLDWKDAYLKTLDDLNVQNIRLVVYWDEAEPKRDTYDFSDVIWQLEEAKKRDVFVIVTLGRKVPRWPECFEPDWWRYLDSKEVQENELHEYVKQVVLALQDYDNITMWQIENEPFWPFGECPIIKKGVVEREIQEVRSVDNRPILVQDSGEGGFWFPSYRLGDYLAISMYRKIWYDFWGVFLGNSIYFKYPLAHWTYKIKADLVGVPYRKIIVTELQAEPWGPAINSKLTDEQKNKTMSRHDFIATLNYAQKAGFKDLYLWGVEWWLWEKEMNNNPFYWDTAKALFN
jgi:hypothetical protein